MKLEDGSVHRFSRFWSPYGAQDIHVHRCSTGGHVACSEILIGSGEECSGRNEDHERVSASDKAAVEHAVARLRSATAASPVDELAGLTRWLYRGADVIYQRRFDAMSERSAIEWTMTGIEAA